MHTCFPSISQLEISQSPTTTIPHLHQTTSFTTNYLIHNKHNSNNNDVPTVQ